MGSKDGVMSEDFEKWFARRTKDEDLTAALQCYSLEQIKDIYYRDYEHEINKPRLLLQVNGQDVDYDIARYYLPEKWEMPRHGRLLYFDDELEDVLLLLVYQLGIKRALEVMADHASIDEAIDWVAEGSKSKLVHQRQVEAYEKRQARYQAFSDAVDTKQAEIQEAVENDKRRIARNCLDVLSPKEVANICGLPLDEVKQMLNKRDIDEFWNG